MATFSKRHYEALAEALRKARERSQGTTILPGGDWGDGELYGIGMAYAEIAAMLRDDNQAFDAERFAIASGMRGTK